MIPRAPRVDSRTPSFRIANLSEPRRRALSILHPSHPLPPAIFAHYMWPASSSWSRPVFAGRGARLKAGTFLAHLERDGLARHCFDTDGSAAGYVLTEWGASAGDAAPRRDRLA